MARRKNWSVEQNVARLRQMEVQIVQGKRLALALCQIPTIRIREPNGAVRWIRTTHFEQALRNQAPRDWVLELPQAVQMKMVTVHL
jgi:hypothetical protein